jgi:hypothetical protein
LSIGDQSIIHADISFEDKGGEVRIGSRTFIGRSNLVCYRSVVIGDDVIMSWGITVVDHDSHSVDWSPIDKRLPEAPLIRLQAIVVPRPTVTAPELRLRQPRTASIMLTIRPLNISPLGRQATEPSNSNHTE